MVPPAVRARGVARFFGDVVALDGVDLDVEAGSVHAVAGPNGAGKSTLLGMLLGLSSADRGELTVLGARVGRRHAAPDGVAGFVDGPGLYPALTARANLRASASLRGLRASVVADALERVGLDEVADEPVRGFSLGMRQRLGLAAALLGTPRLVVLDEPSNGLDPAGKRQVHDVVTALATAGTTVVLSSHRMDDLAALCDEVTLLAAGRVVFSGPVAKLAAESGDLDYRLVTSDLAATRALVLASDDVVIRGPGGRRAPEARAESSTTVRGSLPAMDRLVAALVGAGVAVRELAPVVPPLEAAFLALTDGDTDDHADGDGREAVLR